MTARSGSPSWTRGVLPAGPTARSPTGSPRSRASAAWWAQKLIVEYEEARGLRDRGARRDGTFSAGASRTVAAPVEKIFQAFTDATVRERWLPGVAVEVRTAQPGKVVRLDWPDGTRLHAQFDAKGAERTTVAVEHQRLPDAALVPTMRTYWQERLEALRSLLEE